MPTGDAYASGAWYLIFRPEAGSILAGRIRRPALSGPNPARRLRYRPNEVVLHMEGNNGKMSSVGRTIRVEPRNQ